MTHDDIDLSFLFPYQQGHFACICSRCLVRISANDVALRILKPDTPLAFEEYRYCSTCQSKAGFTPQRSTDKVLAELSRAIREHPRFRATKTEIDCLIRSNKLSRIGVARAATEAKLKALEQNPWEDSAVVNFFIAAIR